MKNVAQASSANIVVVLRSLQVLPDRQHKIEIEAEKIASAFVGATNAERTEALYPRVGKVAAQKYVRRLISLAEQLRDEIDAAPLNLHEAINDSHPTLWKLGEPNNLAQIVNPGLRLKNPLENLVGVLRDADKQMAKSSSAKRGRPSSLVSELITIAAASAFTALTGKPAVPGGDRITGDRSQFEQFLTDLYVALGMSANAEFQAKKLRIKGRKFETEG
jgi:hypothetical protein